MGLKDSLKESTEAIKKRKFFKIKKISLIKLLNQVTLLFNYFKLKNLLLICFLIIFIVPFSLILFFSVSSSKDILVNELSEAVYDATKSTTQIVNGKFNNMNSIVREILTDTEFEEHIKNINENKFNIESHNWLLSRMRSFRAKAISEEVEAILVTTSDGEKHYGELMKTPYYNTDFNGSFAQNRLENSKYTFSIFPLEYDNEDYIVFGFRNDFMYIHIYKKASTIKNLYQDVDLRGGETFIVDEDGKSIISSEVLDITLFGNSLSGKEAGYFISSSSETDHIISFSNIGDTGFKFISVVPLNDIYDKINRNTMDLFNIAFFLLIITIIFSFIISSLIASPVVRLGKLMKIAEKGDLKIKADLKGKSELVHLSTSFNRMISEFGALVKEINEGAHVLNRQAEKIESISNNSKNISEHTLEAHEQLASTIERQATDADESFNRIQELEQKIKNVIYYTSVMQKDIYNMVHTIEEGNSSIDNLVAFTNETGQSYQLVLDSMTELSNNTQYMHKIINLIQGAAESSNLLALNASIEAARAGSEGLGFAVVANEMGKLSISIKEATQEIKTIITNLLNSMDIVYQHSIHSNNMLKKQVENVNSVSDVFHKINELSDVSMNNISGIDQVMEEMNISNQKSYSMVQNIFTTSKETASFTEEVLNNTNNSLELSQELYIHVKNLQELSNGLLFSINKFVI